MVHSEQNLLFKCDMFWRWTKRQLLMKIRLSISNLKHTFKLELLTYITYSKLVAYKSSLWYVAMYTCTFILYTYIYYMVTKNKQNMYPQNSFVLYRHLCPVKGGTKSRTWMSLIPIIIHSSWSANIWNLFLKGCINVISSHRS